MTSLADTYYTVFTKCISVYHLHDDMDYSAVSPYLKDSFEDLLFKKCWIDTVQWHLEDVIREPAINPQQALLIKRRIDFLNQERTNTVEIIDDYFVNKYRSVFFKKGARHNTESIGWAIDRLSILALKIFHIEAEVVRKDASAEHLARCCAREDILNEQKSDLIKGINWLIEEIASGEKIIKVYRQMKMYNDCDFNPVLYRKRQTV